MVHLITVATCSLNQWALDYDGNKERIIQSIREAKKAQASLRVGPELEVTGYGCLDHFLEGEVYTTSWEVLRDIIDHEDCQDILLDIGMPVAHNSVFYNCRVICRNRKILLIRPKMSLANDGNFREMRYFTPWMRVRGYDDHMLPPSISLVTRQRSVKFGDMNIQALDTILGVESCEELFTADAPHIRQGLAGVEIFTNSSGSHHQLRKLQLRIELIREGTRKSGGVYLYANQQGCDGDRLYYDGCAMIICNGEILAQGSQFSLNDVEVVTATVDLDEVRSARFAPSLRMQAAQQVVYPSVPLDLRFCDGDETDLDLRPSPIRAPTWASPEEEISLGPACWLWDYLRRSKQAGFFLPLSGGIDSCATAVIVYSMARQVVKAIKEGNGQVIQDALRICAVDQEQWVMRATPKDVLNKVFHTCFMGTENSSRDTRDRAEKLAQAIGAYHTDMNMDSIVTAQKESFTHVTGFEPRFKQHGGGAAESLALQNIQARLRMVNAYMYAQMLPTVRGRTGGGSLLVLGSANVDECLRGYLTKYDCSSADINPIGGISKTDLKRFIAWAEKNFDLPILESFLTAIPTAELEPITKDYVQSDEADMGMTYDELSVFGRFRKVERLGPMSMWEKLARIWKDERDLNPTEVYEKVRRFFWYFNINRHKMTTLTPSYHAEQYSPDDNRFDLRPFLYPDFSWAWRKIEGIIHKRDGRVNGIECQ